MPWFKILLMIILGIECMGCIAMSGGWRPESKPWAKSLTAVFWALLIVGIQLWF